MYFPLSLLKSSSGFNYPGCQLHKSFYINTIKDAPDRFIFMVHFYILYTQKNLLGLQFFLKIRPACRVDLPMFWFSAHSQLDHDPDLSQPKCSLLYRRLNSDLYSKCKRFYYLYKIVKRRHKKSLCVAL